ncbi:MAG: hypothetical protein K0R93_1214 [Anaerosolibacter sp.]|jgi:hypothetical protein|nr:DUF1186 domain-containing protein [Anaerosolibacter sp.]MDF2546316.1 hypothetical protein [Anaerosolibacter sp.]
MSNKILKSQMLQAVENQMKMNDPKCVNSTFQRLVAEGYTEQTAKEMIAAILVEQMDFILKENVKFNEKEYEERLNSLGRELVLDNDDADFDETEHSVEELLGQIAYNTGCFPKEPIEEIICKKEEAIPFLLDILRKTRDNPEKYRDEYGYFAHIYAAYLLAQFRVKEAYPILIDILGLPDDLPYDLFGDSILEAGSRMLASVCESDASLIKVLAENEEADEYMRGQAIEALAILALHNVLERDEVVAYYKKLINEPAIMKSPLLLATLVNSCCDIYPKELYDDIKNCYEEALVDESVIGMDSVDDAMRLGKDYVLEDSRNNIHLEFIEDTIAELEWWACFEETYKNRINARQIVKSTQTITKLPKIGRNDPCLCGSGKKYKKCCGK